MGSRIGDILQANLLKRAAALGQNANDEEAHKRMRVADDNPLDVRAPLENAFEAMLRRLRAVPIPGKDQVRDTTRRRASRLPSVQQWNDFEVGQRAHYNMFKFNDNFALAELGRVTIESLHGVVTSRAFCSLMLLAYNVKDLMGRDIVGTDAPELLDMVNEFEFTDIDDRPLANVNPVNMVQNALATLAGHENYSAAYCFVASCLLRMYTKSAEPLSKSEKAIYDAYFGFFKYSLPLNNFMPPLDSLKHIKAHFEANTILKNTFYNFLYASESIEEGRPMKEYMYGLHVSYTGMHAYTLFFRNMDVHKIDNVSLFNHLNFPCFAGEIDNLLTIFENFFASENTPGKEKQMWKYARIFESRFFSALSTRRCMLFIATLAELYHKVVPVVGNRDARKIARLQDMTAEMKLLSIGLADMVFRLIASEYLGPGHEAIERAILGDEGVAARVGAGN